MSGKSKRQPKRWSRTEQMNADLLVFLWAWVSTCHPGVEEILAVKAEILNISDSIRRGNLTLDMVNRQLMDECDLLTDWHRRDRGA